jgi:hypothetical protein
VPRDLFDYVSFLEPISPNPGSGQPVGEANSLEGNDSQSASSLLQENSSPSESKIDSGTSEGDLFAF